MKKRVFKISNGKDDLRASDILIKETDHGVFLVVPSDQYKFKKIDPKYFDEGFLEGEVGPYRVTKKDLKDKRFR